MTFLKRLLPHYADFKHEDGIEEDEEDENDRHDDEDDEEADDEGDGELDEEDEEPRRRRSFAAKPVAPNAKGKSAAQNTTKRQGPTKRKGRA